MEKLGKAINFDMESELDKLTAGMNTIDAITEKRNQKATEDAKAAKDERVRQRVQDYLDAAGDEFRSSLDEIGYHLADKTSLLAYAVKMGDSVVVGALVAKAIFADLTEQAESEDE